MAYRPPFAASSATYASDAVASPFPMKRRSQNRVDDEGWEHVSAGRMLAKPANTSTSRWGQSALARSQPKPKTLDEEFPVLGGKPKQQQQQQQPEPTTPPYSPTPVGTLSASSSSLSLAERMKIKLAEEEAERQRREEAERRAQDERERNRADGFVPMLSILQSRRVQNLFNADYQEPVDDLMEPYDAYGADCYNGESDACSFDNDMDPGYYSN